MNQIPGLFQWNGNDPRTATEQSNYLFESILAGAYIATGQNEALPSSSDSSDGRSEEEAAENELNELGPLDLALAEEKAALLEAQESGYRLTIRQFDANRNFFRINSSDDSNDEEEESEAQEDASDDVSDEESLLEIPVIHEMEGESEDEDEGAAKASAFGLKTANELGDDAVIPDTNGIDIPKDVILDRLGNVHEIVNNVVIIKAYTQGESYQVLDEGSVVLTADKTLIGLVYETFGRVEQPMYSIKYKSADEIDADNIQAGMEVYHAPALSNFVFTQALRHFKGSDASNIHDEEVAEDDREFSDDEEEREFKKSRKRQQKGKQPPQSQPQSQPQTQPSPVLVTTPTSQSTKSPSTNSSFAVPYRPLKRPDHLLMTASTTPSSDAPSRNGSSSARSEFSPPPLNHHHHHHHPQQQEQQHQQQRKQGRQRGKDRRRPQQQASFPNRNHQHDQLYSPLPPQPYPMPHYSQVYEPLQSQFMPPMYPPQPNIYLPYPPPQQPLQQQHPPPAYYPPQQHQQSPSAPPMPAHGMFINPAFFNPRQYPSQ